ncbi:acetate kinase, partial [Candidatus Gracilibacteria bacterium]|nr:acetate kinase [Candidatus Gracilibacteria bacterium]
PKAYLYGLPYELYEKHGIRRYGFHGTSHKYVTQQVPKGRTVSCHLGNGCSITASLKHKAIDTSMGFTPLEGIMMGTRSGSIDPAIIFHLKSLGYKLPEIEKMLLKESGFLGFTGISSDMRDIRDAAFKKKNKRALLALETFSYQIAKQVSAYIASLGGLDHLIFTAGIGTHADYVRDAVCKQLPLKLHKTKIHVIPTDESLQICKEANKII